MQYNASIEEEEEYECKVLPPRFAEKVLVSNIGKDPTLLERARVVAYVHAGKKVHADFVVLAAEDDSF